MPHTLFIDTNSLPRAKAAQGEFTEILNSQLTGAKNVVGTLRWLTSDDSFSADATGRHQLLYVMEGAGRVRLDGAVHALTQGMGVYLGPSESAILQGAPGATMKLFHLVVPRIPT